MMNPLYQWRIRSGDKKIPALQVGKRIGVTPQAVYYWEKGAVRPREFQWEGIARIVDLPVPELISRWASWHKSIGNERESAELAILSEYFGEERIVYSTGTRVFSGDGSRR
jgi:DNA-binding XRE family transcriptional regulator